jgi:hypothetical protein
MATSQNVPEVLTQSKLSVVPFPQPQTVTQLELTALLSLRGRLHQIQQQVEQAESSIKARLESGCVVEEGDHSAELKEQSRRNVAWREVCERLGDRLFGNGKGGPYCERVLSSTKPTRTVSLKIQ